jgi:hypothetical protein
VKECPRDHSVSNELPRIDRPSVTQIISPSYPTLLPKDMNTSGNLHSTEPSDVRDNLLLFEAFLTDNDSRIKTMSTTHRDLRHMR